MKPAQHKRLLNIFGRLEADLRTARELIGTETGTPAAAGATTESTRNARKPAGSSGGTATKKKRGRPAANQPQQ